MANWYPSGSGSSSGGWFVGSKSSTYAQTALALAKAHPAGHHDLVGGFLSHLANDVVDTAKGLPEGVVHIATQNPIKSVKEIAHAEAQTWGPLAHGDYNTFLHNFYEHPLGPILDVAGVLTGGAGLVAKAGIIGDLGVGGERALQLGDADVSVGRYADNPIIRARQRSFDQITKTFPKSTPLIGESARGFRALKRIADSGLAKDKRVVDTYIKSAHGLNNPALHTAYLGVSTGQSPLEILKDMQEHIDVHNHAITGKLSKAVKIRDDLQKQLSDHANGEIISHAQGGTSKWERQLNKLTKLHSIAQANVEDLGSQLRTMEPLTKAALSNPKAQQLFHDAQAGHLLLRGKGYDVAAGEIEKVNRVTGEKTMVPKAKVRIGQALAQVKVSKDVEKILRARDAARDASDRDATIRNLHPDRQETRKYLHQLLRQGATFEPDKLVLYENKTGARIGQIDDAGRIHGVGPKGVATGGVKIPEGQYAKLSIEEAQKHLDEMFPMQAPDVSRTLYHPEGIDKVLKKLQAKHGGTGRAEPVYFPDKMMIKNPTSRLRGQKYSKGLQASGSIKNHQNLGALYMAGVINHDPLVLAHQAMSSIMVAHAADLAELLRQHSTAYDGPDIPKGYVALNKMSLSRGYLNEYLPKFRQEMQAHLAKGTGAESNVIRTFLDHHVTHNPIDAGEHKLIVPQKLVDQLTPEYQKSSDFARAFYKKPQAVWKHMVLAGRPLPFIVNNVVGNTVMYGLRHAGPAGIKALVHNVNEERAFEELLSEHHLTFGQAHAIKRPGRISKVVNKAYDVVGAHEHLLRRASMIASAKSMPAVQDALRALRKEGYKAETNDSKSILHAAIERADKSHPGTIKQIGEHIDDTMGDYRQFSKGEQAIRSIMPFYSWNRHAARAYYRLLTDRPLTAALTTRVGQLGSDQTNKLLGDVPSFMKEYVPSHLLKALGYSDSKHLAAFNASVLNPESTVASSLKTIEALVSGKPGEAPADLTSNLSPLITAPIEAATGKSLFTGAPLKGNFATGHGALASSIADTLVNLPIPKLLATVEPGALPGSAHPNPNEPQFTPTGRPKKQHEDTISKDWQTQLLNTLFGIPAKSLNVKAAKEWQQSLETTASNSKYHVAKKRAKKSKSSWYS